MTTTPAKADTTGATTGVAGDLVAVGSHAEWMALARDSYGRLVTTFAQLDSDDWSRSTPCEGWSVRDLAGHVVGSMRAAASLREIASQQRAVKRRASETGEQEVDAMTAIQIERASDLSEWEAVSEMRSLVEPAVRGRSRIPGVLLRRAGFRVRMGDIDEKWTLGYFLGCILTRDAWLHRVDLADATEEVPVIDDADRAIVADVALEWAARHRRPVDLTLTGPAGGHLVAGRGGDGIEVDAIEVDAIEFCRIVSGRSSHGHPLLRQQVPF